MLRFKSVLVYTAGTWGWGGSVVIADALLPVPPRSLGASGKMRQGHLVLCLNRLILWKLGAGGFEQVVFKNWFRVAFFKHLTWIIYERIAFGRILIIHSLLRISAQKQFNHHASCENLKRRPSILAVKTVLNETLCASHISHSTLLGHRAGPSLCCLPA